jgi:hypothetical protein
MGSRRLGATRVQQITVVKAAVARANYNMRQCTYAFQLESRTASHDSCRR